MNLFLWNLLLAIFWAAVGGTLTGASLLTGFAAGYIVLLIAKPLLGQSKYYTTVWRALGFIAFYIWEIFISSLRVAHDVLTPTHHMRPGVLAVSLDARTAVEITLLANLVSLTPGTLSLDVSPDRRVLYLHVMYLDADPDVTRRGIKVRLERRVLELLRMREPREG